jgi:hypothetical protein
MAIEEHGGGRQYVRFRWWPWCPVWAYVVPASLVALALLASKDAPIVAAVLGLGAVAHLLWLAIESATSIAAFQGAANTLGEAVTDPTALVGNHVDTPGVVSLDLTRDRERSQAIPQQVRSTLSLDDHASRHDDRAAGIVP